MDNVACCFIGHRKIQDKEAVLPHVKAIVEMLIKEKGVRIFNFGSKSEFDDLCYAVVTEFQNNFPDIIRVFYNRKSEYAVGKDEKANLEEIWSRLLKKDVSIKDCDSSKMSDRVFRAGKASYVERNREMIDDSDFCVFFYIEEYKPETELHRKSSGKSGTDIAYEYAVGKKKPIINVAELIR